MSSHLLCVLVIDVLTEVLQLFRRGDRVRSDAVRHGAQDVAQVLVLLQQNLQLLHPISLLLHQSLHLSADVLLLLEHCDASLLLNKQRRDQQTHFTRRYSKQAFKSVKLFIISQLITTMTSRQHRLEIYLKTRINTQCYLQVNIVIYKGKKIFKYLYKIQSYHCHLAGAIKNIMCVLNISCDGGCYLKHRQLELQVEFLHFCPACLNAA